VPLPLGYWGKCRPDIAILGGMRNGVSGNVLTGIPFHSGRDRIRTCGTFVRYLSKIVP
jgi:hypothetical protein